MPGKKFIYLDYAATTPLDVRVYRAMKPFVKTKTARYGNPHSLHRAGQCARREVDAARVQVAEYLACQPHEVIFTSGATESNNIAILGLLEPGQHGITTAIEHASVMAPFEALEKRGVAVSYSKPSTDGLIDVADILENVRLETRFVSVHYVNNEIGTIQPIAEIAKALGEINSRRLADQKIFFHTDAAQAASFLPLRVAELGVDALTLTGHKMSGPKGVGVLYRRTGMPMRPLFFGGSQEYKLRPGTLNVAAIVGQGAAARLLQASAERESAAKRMRILRDRLLAGIQRYIPDVVVNGDMRRRAPSNLNISFPDVDGENLLIILDKAGIAVSAGSACSAGATEPSHVLRAIGVTRPLLDSSLRITLGTQTRRRDIDAAIKKIIQTVRHLRAAN